MTFSLFGIPVRVQPIFWIVALLLGAPRGTSPREIAELALWVAVLFVSILAHELGHAFAMRAYGRSPSIELWGLGGLTHWGEGAPVSPGKDILVSLAGPGAGLALGALVFGVTRLVPPSPGSLMETFVFQALWINVIWGLVNLVPILPLDGGHVLESGAGWLAGNRGRKFAYGLSLLLATGVIAVSLYRRQFWIAFLGLWCASISYKKWSSPAPAAAPAPPDQHDGAEIWQLLASGDADAAVRAAEPLIAKAPEGASRDRLLEALAWARIELGDERGALAAAERISGRPSETLAARLAIAEGRLAEGLARLESEVERNRSSMPALVLSSVYIGEERPDLTLELLRSKRGAKLSPESHLRITAQLFHADQYALCFEACALAFERFAQPQFAYNAACALARLGRSDEGLSWLGRAVDGGFHDAALIDGDPDLARLRTQPGFADIRARVP